MKIEVRDALERAPIIAATDRAGWQRAVLSDAEVLFHLGADIITVSDDIKAAKRNGKFVFIHIDFMSFSLLLYYLLNF